MSLKSLQWESLTDGLHMWRNDGEKHLDGGAECCQWESASDRCGLAVVAYNQGNKSESWLIMNHYESYWIIVFFLITCVPNLALWKMLAYQIYSQLSKGRPVLRWSFSSWWWSTASFLTSWCRILETKNRQIHGRKKSIWRTGGLHFQVYGSFSQAGEAKLFCWMGPFILTLVRYLPSSRTSEAVLRCPSIHSCWH